MTRGKEKPECWSWWMAKGKEGQAWWWIADGKEEHE
jgi:hypothetical protein